jgi:hypothetical protein
MGDLDLTVGARAEETPKLRASTTGQDAYHPRLELSAGGMNPRKTPYKALSLFPPRDCARGLVLAADGG